MTLHLEAGMERIIKSTPAEELHFLIAQARTEMLEYRALGEELLAECAEERMNKRLEELGQLAEPSR